MINAWWVGKDRERFWMEITNRVHLGADLWAPRVDKSGGEHRSYSLAKYVRPGDLVLHWRTQPESAIVAYSYVTGSRTDSQNHESYGRRRPPSGEEPRWLVSLSGPQMLRTPVTLQRLRELEEQVQKVCDNLKDRIKGSLYFPYVFSVRRQLRTAQEYLTKFPYDLVSIIPELFEMWDLARAEPGEPPRLQQSENGSRTLCGGRQSDAELRRAIEHHAVETVSTLYRDNKYHVQDVGDHKSWDITACREAEEIHIEVKGSAGVRAAVDLTEGEVHHAEDHQPTHLVVVDCIDWVRTSDGIRCSGGRVRRWRGWVPARSVLRPTAYRYPLPLSDESE